MAILARRFSSSSALDVLDMSASPDVFEAIAVLSKRTAKFVESEEPTCVWSVVNGELITKRRLCGLGQKTRHQQLVESDDPVDERCSKAEGGGRTGRAIRQPRGRMISAFGPYGIRNVAASRKLKLDVLGFIVHGGQDDRFALQDR